MSLSASALAALHKLGGYTLETVSGSDYWMYEGKTLDDIRVARETLLDDSLEQDTYESDPHERLIDPAGESTP